MANQSLFSTFRGAAARPADTLNNAGGIAYALSPEAALAQYAATGCLNGTFYMGAEQQLETVLNLAANVDAHFLAQTAIYCRERGFMKDMPALLCAILAQRDVELLEEIFFQVIDNGKMLRNFVQIVRSGVTGRKSLGSAPKRLLRQWLNRATDGKLLSASVGQSPSLADVIKMVHPKPDSAERETFYAWILGKEANLEKLPLSVREYELWKMTRCGKFPNVPFQMLTALDLGEKEWREIAETASWQMTRMNLNTFARQGVFKDRGLVKKIAARLADPEAVRRARVFPYQLMVAFKNCTQDVPDEVKNALQSAMETATENIPSVAGRIVICPDVSGSMHSPVTGFRTGSTSAVRCLDVAALMAASLLRKNQNAIVLPFMEKVLDVKLNSFDSVMTNAQKLASLPPGGTNCSAPLAWLNAKKESPDLLIFISDNESWVDSASYGRFGGSATATMQEWQKLKLRSPKARMVCLDIQPNAHSQATSQADIMNIGGFSDQVFELVARFADGELGSDQLVAEIKNHKLKTFRKQRSAS